MVDTNQRTHAFYTENSSDYWSLCAAIFVLGGMINISLAHRDDVIICRFLVSMWKIVSVVRLSSFERSTARNIPQTGLPSSTPLSRALSLTVSISSIASDYRKIAEDLIDEEHATCDMQIKTSINVMLWSIRMRRKLSAHADIAESGIIEPQPSPLHESGK